MSTIQQLIDRVVSLEVQLRNELRDRDMTSRVLCGGIAGIVAKTAIAPAERVKMTFQISSESFTIAGAVSKGINIVKKDGVLALWRGHSTTVLRVAPYAGISYAVHDFTEQSLQSYYQTKTLSFSGKFLSGSAGGVVGTLLTYPLDVLRVRLALIPNSTWLSTLKQGGLYHGIQPTLLGIIPYSGIAWTTKQTLHELYPSFKFGNRKTPTIVESLVMNAIAGLVGQLFTYPLDIARRRLQMITYPDRKPTMFEVLGNLYKTEGRRGLTKGFTLNIIKGPITLSLSLTTYDILRRWIDQDTMANSIHQIHNPTD